MSNVSTIQMTLALLKDMIQYPLSFGIEPINLDMRIRRVNKLDPYRLVTICRFVIKFSRTVPTAAYYP
jgi:hypothetical protein